MAQESLNGLQVAILVANDFEEVEMVEPRKVLDQAGATTKLIASTEGMKIGQMQVVTPAKGQVQAINHDKPSNMYPVDLPLEEANADDFDALLLPGGALSADQLRVLDLAKDFVTAFDEIDKPIAVICHGPWTLVSAGLVDGRMLTSWPTLQDDIENAGGEWMNEEMVRDINWVSSRGPADLPAFNDAMIRIFAEWQQTSMAKAA